MNSDKAIQYQIADIGQRLKALYGSNRVEIYIDEPRLPYDGVAIMNEQNDRKLDIYWCDDEGGSAGQWMYEMVRFDPITNDMTMIGPDPLELYARAIPAHGEPGETRPMDLDAAVEYAALFGFYPEPPMPDQIPGAPDFPDFVSDCLTEWSEYDLREALVEFIMSNQKSVDGWNESYQEMWGIQNDLP